MQVMKLTETGAFNQSNVCDWHISHHEIHYYRYIHGMAPSAVIALHRGGLVQNKRKSLFKISLGKIRYN